MKRKLSERILLQISSCAIRLSFLFFSLWFPLYFFLSLFCLIIGLKSEIKCVCIHRWWIYWSNVYVYICSFHFLLLVHIFLFLFELSFRFILKIWICFILYLIRMNLYVRFSFYFKTCIVQTKSLNLYYPQKSHVLFYICETEIWPDMYCTQIFERILLSLVLIWLHGTITVQIW